MMGGDRAAMIPEMEEKSEPLHHSIRIWV